MSFKGTTWTPTRPHWPIVRARRAVTCEVCHRPIEIDCHPLTRRLCGWHTAAHQRAMNAAVVAARHARLSASPRVAAVLTVAVLTCVLIAAPAGAQTPPSYRFGLFAASAVPATSTPVWQTTWLATAATCDQPAEPAGTTGALVLDPKGIAAAYDDPAVAGRRCIGPLVQPVLPACATAPCPSYAGWLQLVEAGGSSPWAIATPSLTMPLTTQPPPPPPPPPADACAAPFGAEAIAIFPTTWQFTSKKPGSKMRLNYQLSSKSPVTEIRAKLNGAVAVGEPAAGTGSGGLWFIQPGAGSYKLSLWAKNTFGCTREVVAGTLVIQP